MIDVREGETGEREKDGREDKDNGEKVRERKEKRD